MSSGPSGKACLREDAMEVLRRLRDAGHIAYFAGGCVRDLLLGLEPKDYDIATDAPPDAVRQLFRNTQSVGAAFGVILVRQRSSMIEVATFRSDGAYIDGRRPSHVHFTSAQEDARRRDFTINGLFLDPVSNQVIDYVGGQADLQARVLRAIGDASERFAEDYLRMLRAVRFAARFNLTIDPATVHAIVSHRTRLKQISPERIAEELRLMLTPGTRVLAWRLLKTLDLLAEIFRHVPLPQKRPGNRPVAILETLAPDAPIAFGTALATATIALWLEADPSEGALRNLFEKSQIGACVSAMRKTLRISNDEADLMADILSGLGVLLAGDLPSLAAKKRFLARPDARETGHVLDALAAGGHFQHRISTLKPELETLAQTEFAPPPLITGDDLTAAGHAPGPAFKMALDAAYDAQLEGRAASRETAMEIAGAFFK